MLPLTERQREARNWIERYIATHNGTPPSLEEISEGLGTTLAGGAYLVRALTKRGHAIRDPRGWRRTLQLIPENRA